jgi:hypothetical protein
MEMNLIINKCLIPRTNITLNEMRILHIWHNQLPDSRVEKAASVMKARGHNMIFLGGKPSSGQFLNVFDEVHYLPKRGAFSLLNPIHRKKWLNKIRSLNPDVIYAHDILVANYLLDLDIPGIYDDHEYWSKQILMERKPGIKQKISVPLLQRKVVKWERDLVSRFPTIVTNERVAEEHRKFGTWVGVTLNCPSLKQVMHIHPDDSYTRQGLVYTGADFKKDSFDPHRDMTGLKDIIEFDIITGLPHHEMMTQLTKYRIGLTPWRYHPILEFKNQNRNYEYLHAGLQVLLSEHLRWQFPNDPYVHSFSDYEEILDVLERIPDVKSSKIIEHARKNYLWDNQEHVILEAYEKVLNNQ